MRWLGIALAVFGLVLFFGTFAYESSLKARAVKVQVIRGETLVGKPQPYVFDQEPKFTKGEGPEQSRFLEEAEFKKVRYVPFSAFSEMATLSRAGALILCAFGVVGFWFERWRQRTGNILRGKFPD